jgi:Mg/Co/Ni transporter MgtE
VFLAVTVVFGWVYAWASPWVFPKTGRAGFAYGLVHGALMPMALPSLVMGQDVDIYAANNSGRPYKLGYIVGINVCGLVFFGTVFWRPTRKSS